MKEAGTTSIGNTVNEEVAYEYHGVGLKDPGYILFTMPILKQGWAFILVLSLSSLGFRITNKTTYHSVCGSGS